MDFSIASGDESFILDTTTSGSKLCVPIAIIDDKIALEGEEQFTLFFAGLPNDEAQVGPNSEVCVSILDDDGESKNSSHYNSNCVKCIFVYCTQLWCVVVVHSTGH